jgi:hypothetical protein
MYGIELAFSGIKNIPVFVKIGNLVRKLKVNDFRYLLFPLRNEFKLVDALYMYWLAQTLAACYVFRFQIKTGHLR